MNDLYIGIMEKIAPLMREYWQLTIIACGTFFLLGAIFRWKWVCDPQGDNVLGFNAFVYRAFGEKGYRILHGLTGIILIAYGVGMLIY